ncbi:MAG TPA: septum formation family protein [Propionibacteriaceae bacterium]|nr:septum formation family protein [Propionibacteriaceae bacterium]
MSQLPPAARPPDTLKVRGRLGGVWLALWLAGAAGCVLVSLYGDHAWWLPLFLFLAAVVVVLAVRGFGRGIDADGNGVVVRNMLRARPIPWRELAAIEFKGVSSEALENMYYNLVFQRHDGTRVTAEAPGGGTRPGEYLFELRERLFAMRDEALGYPHAPADRPSDAAGTDMEAAPPAEPPSWVPPPWPGSTDTEAASPAAAARSRVKRWSGAVASVAVALAIAFVPFPSLGSLLWNVGRVFHVDVMPLRVYWEDLQPGMCVRDDPNGMDYLVVDCNAEHEEEVMSRGTLAGSDEWPGDAAVETAALEKCMPAFASYVGLELHESRLDLDFSTPDQESWNDGKATLICFVLDPNHDQITRALRGAHE